MLSDKSIRQQLLNGNIVIDPFKDEQMNTNSYDVCMGAWACYQKKPSFYAVSIDYNTREGAEDMWQRPYDLSAAGVIAVSPGETILAHTQEIIGGRNGITTEMRAKSTTARYGLSVCKCAGLGDVGFISRWTMEITNHSFYTIKIPIGEPIAQILFHDVGPTLKKYNGRYGQGEWSPEDMLPKGRRER